MEKITKEISVNEFIEIQEVKEVLNELTKEEIIERYIFRNDKTRDILPILFFSGVLLGIVLGFSMVVLFILT